MTFKYYSCFSLVEVITGDYSFPVFLVFLNIPNEILKVMLKCNAENATTSFILTFLFSF